MEKRPSDLMNGIVKRIMEVKRQIDKLELH